MEQINKNELIRLRLSKDESMALKGVALLLLLFHHLFYIQNGMYDDVYVHGIGIVRTLGVAAKVCVALFVFLSGYGLAAVAAKQENVDWKHFYKRRFSKLYINYWLIWLLFVPIGIFCFDITFERVYGDGYFAPLVADLTGTLNLFGKYGYNPTWWFYSCIIVLYALFPLILRMNNSKVTFWIMIAMCICLFLCPWTFVQPFKWYLLVFVLGMMCCSGRIGWMLPASLRNKVSAGGLFQGSLSVIQTCILTGILMLTVLARICFSGYGLMIDTVIALLMVLTYKNLRIGTRVDQVFRHLGKHSFNIFLFHTFIYYLFFEELVYWSGNPLVIYVTLLAICLPKSYVIEYIRSLNVSGIGLGFLKRLKHD